MTGLVWENKTNDGGIHDTNRTYRWGGVGAQIVAGQTFGERYSDWDELVNGSNSEQLCGFSDWRIPSRGELYGIVNYNGYIPSLDTDYFSNTQSSLYWSNLPNADDSEGAWGVNFDSEHNSHSSRSNYSYARLVRAEH